MGGYTTRVIIALTALVLAAGCGGGSGSDDAGSDEGSDPGHDVAAETGDVEDEDAAATGTLTVQVVEAIRTCGGHMFENTTDPAEGATVALDAPGGTRSELTTGADGRVTFEGLDWSLGTADVTVFKADYVLHSVLELDGSEEEITVGLDRAIQTDGFVAISGTAANMADTTHSLAVSSTNGRSLSQVAGADWRLAVEPGAGFTIVAAEMEPLTTPSRSYSQEIHDWVVLEHAAVTDDTTVDIDFAVDVTPVNVSNSVNVPDVRTDSPLAGTTSIYSVVWDGWLYIGFSELTAPNTDGTAFDLDFEYVEPAGLSSVETVYRVQPYDSFLGFSRVVVPGFPEAGTHDLGFLDLPNVHQSHLETYALHETEFTWDLYDSDVEVFLFVYVVPPDPLGMIPAWRVDAPVDSTSISVPDAPSTCDEETYFGGRPFHAHLHLWTHPDGDGAFRFVTGKCLQIEL